MADELDTLRKPTAFSALARHSAAPNPDAPPEPVLDLDDIQGNIVPGFNKDTTAFAAYKITNVNGAKKWLADLLPFLSPAEEVLAFRRLFSARRRRHGQRKPEHLIDTNTNVAFSFAALRALAGASALQFDDEAFSQDLYRRSALLGEPTSGEGSPKKWKFGGHESNAADILVFTGGDDERLINERMARLRASAKKNGLRLLWQETGRKRSDLPGHEMFGFDDGVSQPGVRGMISNTPGDYLTPRFIDPSEGVEALLYGLPGQDLVWPGEFLFGYPANGPDPLLPGPVKAAKPAWAKNGSFLVMNRFRQDVRLFWTFMRDQAKRLAKTKGFKHLTDKKLAAMLVGRWESGAPFSRIQSGDDDQFGQDQYANNHFFFGVDTHTSKLIPIPHYPGDPYPNAKTDNLGLTCPLAAHIRKVNTRDLANDQGGHNTTYRARILRRGTPFGEPLPHPFARDPQKGNRGLFFVSYQTSIEDQYELLRGTWMGDAKPPRMPGGDDMIVGMNGRPGEKRGRQCLIFGDDAAPATVSTNGRGGWVIPTGGGYFFSPSLSAIREVLMT